MDEHNYAQSPRSRDVEHMPREPSSGQDKWRPEIGRLLLAVSARAFKGNVSRTDKTRNRELTDCEVENDMHGYLASY